MAKLQDGIYWDHDQVPPRHFAIMFLRVAGRPAAAEVDLALSDLVAIWRGLASGQVPHLPGTTVPASGFTWLLAFGRKIFDIKGAARSAPRGLTHTNVVESALPGGGGAVVLGGGIDYAPDVTRNPGSEEIAVQFLGDTPLAVARAVVETESYLQQARAASGGLSPVHMGAVYTGFNREDHRSWIGHHDGISNLEAGRQRQDAIEVPPVGLDPKDRWTAAGTYLAFMRLDVDLPLWNALPRQDQDFLVGRDKITGCPFGSIDAAGRPTAVVGCPVLGTQGPTDPLNAAFREPPDGVPQQLRESHVQRANHHQDPASRPENQRFFRQGYEFLDPPDGTRPLRAGLNFVSFQAQISRLRDTLRRNTWLGGVNFGGAPGPRLIHARAAGFYFCPADGVPDEAYPGQSILRAQAM
ncbi:Dyp-type peroxidase [Antarctobacter sp.]|uniref:Dyp-type peroxidase n=1 Tax=Antarctobacter sp. TaxID=1872577 RepID=UPI003A8DD0D7